MSHSNGGLSGCSVAVVLALAAFAGLVCGVGSLGGCDEPAAPWPSPDELSTSDPGSAIDGAPVD